MCRLFELPLLVVVEAEETQEICLNQGISLFQTLLVWAMGTLDNSRARCRNSKSFEEVKAFFPNRTFTIQCGAHARQGELICDFDRLAFRFPIISNIPDDLSETRRYWLRRVLTEAQNRWRMVRLSLVRELTGSSVHAEVDLTITPTEAFPGLAATAMAALHGVVEWVVPSVVFLANGQNECRALEVTEVDPASK